MHARGAGAFLVHREDVADVERPLRRDAEPLERDREDPRIRLRHTDEVRVDDELDFVVHVALLEMPLRTTVRVRDDGDAQAELRHAIERVTRAFHRPRPESVRFLMREDSHDEWPNEMWRTPRLRERAAEVRVDVAAATERLDSFVARLAPVVSSTPFDLRTTQ